MTNTNAPDRTVVTIDANPAPALVAACRYTLARAGLDPNSRREVLAFSAYGVAPLAVAIAAAQLAASFECPMGCGRHLDPGNSDAVALDLCPECYDEAGLENEHADGYHDDGPADGCPECAGR